MSLAEITEAYHSQAMNSERARDYFAGFGVSIESMREFGLGYIMEPVRDSHESLTGCAVLPYVTVSGKVIQLRFNPFEWDIARRFEQGVFEVDYPLAVPEAHLFNVRHALPGLRTHETVLVEDTLSAVLLRQQGARVVGVPGYERFHLAWLELFRESMVTLVSNEASQVESLGLLRRFSKAGIDHEAVVLPGERTLADLFQEGATLSEIRSSFHVKIRDHGPEFD